MIRNGFQESLYAPTALHFDAKELAQLGALRSAVDAEKDVGNAVRRCIAAFLGLVDGADPRPIDRLVDELVRLLHLCAMPV